MNESVAIAEKPPEVDGMTAEMIEAAIQRAQDRIAWVSSRPSAERERLIAAVETRDALVLMHLAKVPADETPAATVIFGKDIIVGDLQITEDARVLWKGRMVRMSFGKVKMLRRLASQPGMTVPYLDLLHTFRPVGFCAGNGELGWQANIRTFIKHIRTGFAQVDPGFNEIGNYPGVGYFWRGPRAGA
jgi:DNA-binding response OmpR family regulator